jgi:hypothetical protein
MSSFREEKAFENLLQGRCNANKGTCHHLERKRLFDISAGALQPIIYSREREKEDALGNLHQGRCNTNKGKCYHLERKRLFDISARGAATQIREIVII